MSEDRTINIYDRNAAHYIKQWDTFIPKDNAVDLVSLLHAQLTPPQRVLDAGSGGGRDLRRLVSLGYEASGIDASVRLATIASQYAPVSVGDMRSMSFPTASFDGLLSSGSLLHFTAEDALKAIKEFRRVVKPGGPIVMNVKKGSGEMIAEDGRFFHLYDEDSFDELIAAAGLKIDYAVTDDSGVGGTVWLIRLARSA